MPLIYAFLVVLTTVVLVILTTAFVTVIDWIDEHWERMKHRLHCRKRTREWERLAADEADPIIKAYKIAVCCWYANEYHSMGSPKNSNSRTLKAWNDTCRVYKLDVTPIPARRKK